MSGIVGVFEGSSAAEAPLRSVVKSMSRNITHHGICPPEVWDAPGIAVARLHHGTVNPEPQPIESETSALRLWLVGEVYGYESERSLLERRGHRFRHQENDAEFCLHLYDEYGPKAFEALNGSFLIVIHDAATQTLLVISDRFRTHRLFYVLEGRRLAFATELRALFPALSSSNHLNLEGVFEYLMFGALLNDSTYYKEIHGLPPAGILRCQDGECTVETYWQIEYRDDGRPEEYHAEALADALRTAVARRTRGDLRVGLLLGGGMDTRTILAADEDRRISPTFSVCGSQSHSYEARIAGRIAETAGREHRVLERAEDYYSSLMDEAVDVGNGSCSFIHAHFLGFAPKLGEETEVLLHGCGFNALFHDTNLLLRRLTILSHLVELPLLRRLDDVTLSEPLDQFLSVRVRGRKMSAVVVPALRSDYEDYIQDRISAISSERARFGGTAHHALDVLRLKAGLPGAQELNYTSLRPHLVERMIAADNDLFDVHLQLPPHARIGSSVLERALRLLSPELARIPDNNTRLRPMASPWAKLIVGKGALYLRARLHLRHPLHGDHAWPRNAELIRRSVPLRSAMEAALFGADGLPPEVFDIETISKMYWLLLHQQAEPALELFQLVTLGQWWKKYAPLS